jgi:predicted ABC-type transport system involved in lysophospholipase L1 biosynthesis ATPase subunit
MTEPVLAARGVTRSFREGGGALTVLAGVDLVVAAGERIAIVGVSGSG